MATQKQQFHDLYQRHSSDVYRFALWLSGSVADAEDITSETFVRAWAGRHPIHTETVKAYLFTIAAEAGCAAHESGVYEMNVTRNVILDLLPLYLADEASADSRALVEEFLASDPQLAKLAERAELRDFDVEVPVPLTKEHELASFARTKSLLFQQKLFMGLAIFTSLLWIAFRFEDGSVQWLWQDAPAVGGGIFVLASLFWIAFGNVNYSLNK